MMRLAVLPKSVKSFPLWGVPRKKTAFVEAKISSAPNNQPVRLKVSISRPKFSTVSRQPVGGPGQPVGLLWRVGTELVRRTWKRYHHTKFCKYFRDYFQMDSLTSTIG